MDEIWKPIRGYEGLYEVSNLGRVKSLERIMEYKNRWGGISRRVKPEQLMVSRPNCRWGYYEVPLQKDGVQRFKRLHRLVADAFCPNPEGYNEVNHIDENRANNCAVNLEWCNHHYNTHYGTRNKRLGEILRKRMAKVTEREVIEIRGLIEKGMRMTKVAEMFGLSYSQIRRIKTGQNWGWVT